MIRNIAAGALYFAIVFALGFALGTVRVMAVAPSLGEWPATLIELPVMLAASWLLCAWIVRRWAVAPSAVARLTVGGTAFALLMLAEILLGTTLFGRSITEQVGSMTSGPGALGLASQTLFGFFPLLQLHTSKHPSRPSPGDR